MYEAVALLFIRQFVSQYLLHHYVTLRILFCLLPDISSQTEEQHIDGGEETESIGLFLFLLVYFIMKGFALIVFRQVLEAVDGVEHIFR